jgi:chorismate synthase
MADLVAVEELQMEVWGMPERSVVPTNLLAIVGDTGGDIIVAKNNREIPVGFVFTVGTVKNTLILHMIGVHPDFRLHKDLGWNLSVLQGLLALRKGISKIAWTFDPLRGSNARLNLEKLGGVATKYTVNKYGIERNQLYGEVPTDRFTIEWDLRNPRTIQRLLDVQAGRLVPLSLADVAHLPVIVSAEGILPPKFLVEIPFDVDTVPAAERDEVMIRWRTQLRNIFGQVLSCETTTETTHREAVVTGFATSKEERRSFYVVEQNAESMTQR